MNRHSYLRLKGKDGVTARTSVRKMKVVRTDVIPPRLGEMDRLGGRGDYSEFGEIQRWSAKRIWGQEIVDGVTGDPIVCIRVQRTEKDVGQAVGSQRANPRFMLMCCLRQFVLVIRLVQSTANSQLLQVIEALNGFGP